MSMVTVLTLRSPENAARAMEVGYGTLAIQALQRFPSSGQTQKQACLMIRNLVVRNPENRYAVELTHLSFWCDNLCRISLASIEISGWHSNAICQCSLQQFLHPFSNVPIDASTSDTWCCHCRTILLNDGAEKLIRKAKVMHGGCKDAASSALRDLGLDNYNA